MPEPSPLAEALAKFQADLPRLAKSETADADRYSYQYAPLDEVAAKVLPALGAVGLAFTAWPSINGAGKFVLSYSLLHASGERVTGEFPLPLSERTTAQQIGSWLTYARRYCLLAVTGVHPGGEDDDGAQAASLHHPDPAPQTQSPPRLTVPPPVPASEEATMQVDEQAQVLASLAHQLAQRGCSVTDLKTKVYDIAYRERLLRAMVVNPFTGTMVPLSSVITNARAAAEERQQASDQPPG